MKQNIILIVVCVIIGLCVKPTYMWASAMTFDPIETGDFSSLDIIRNNENKLVMLSDTRCPYCRKARVFLTENDMPYVEVFIDKDKTAADLFDNVLQETATPVILTKNAKLVGFNANALKNLYSNHL
jgi:glutaredoxin